MKKLKNSKIIILLLLIFGAIMLFPTRSHAVEYWDSFWNRMNNNEVNINDVVNITMNTPNGKNDLRNLYCIDHSQNAPTGGINYTVVNIVDIVGRKSTGTGINGKEYTMSSDYNAMLAYILNLKNGNLTEKRKHQELIWYFMANYWKNNVGKYYKNVYALIGTKTAGYRNFDDAKQYVDELGDETDLGEDDVLTDDQREENGEDLDKEIILVNPGDELENTTNEYTKNLIEEESGLTYKDLTDKDNIIITRQGDNTLAGPFKWEYNGKVDTDKIEVYCGDNKIEGVKFGKLNSDKQFEEKAISSGNEFYILFPNANLKGGIVTLRVKSYTVIKTAKVYFLSALNASSKQPLIAYLNDDKTLEKQWEPIEVQLTIDLSGFVWLDRTSEKADVRNDLYKENPDFDSNDILMEGVTVRLMDKTTGKIVTNIDGKECVAKTDKEGKYKFEDVFIADLDNYYIQFEYDGMTYKNVVMNTELGKDNASKAAEQEETRNKFNAQFAQITSGESQYTGFSRDLEGKITHNLKYKQGEKQYQTMLDSIDDGIAPITAETEDSYISKRYDYLLKQAKGQGGTQGKDSTGNTDTNTTNTTGSSEEIKEKETVSGTTKTTSDTTGGTVEEITFINLGLYEREQPDLALVKDLQNVRLEINGYSHVYEYGNRFENLDKDSENGFNVGVRFDNELNPDYAYKQSIYREDALYKNEADKDKELKVYVTYCIQLRNESTNLKARVNSIVDYYDSRYELSSIDYQIDEATHTVPGDPEIRYTNPVSYEGNNAYNQLVIQTNAVINPQESKNVYVEFKLNKEATLDILNDKLTLGNVVEINNYSILDTNDNLYAGIDKDSAPGNCIPNEFKTYEDDTDNAPALLLEVNGYLNRKITGTVFEDTPLKELLEKNYREGDGIYGKDSDGNDEHGIQDVTVRLHGESREEDIYLETKTDTSGNFVFGASLGEEVNEEDVSVNENENISTNEEKASYIIPDKYQITYIWGGQEYTATDGTVTKYDVANYKATKYNDEASNSEQWWEKEDPRYSDATDDYNLRQSIDNGTDTTGQMISKTSETFKMDLGIEEKDKQIETNITIVDGDRFITGEHETKNIDYGVIERPKQELSMRKRVSHIKITNPRGTVMVDTDVELDGTIKEPGAMLQDTVQQNPEHPNGYIWVEMDNELMQGSTIEVTYAIDVKNDSEYDYQNENFYKYGQSIGDETNPVKISATGINDYLSNNLTYEIADNTWEVVNEEEGTTKHDKIRETIIPPSGWEQIKEITDENGNVITKYKKDLGSTTTSSETAWRHSILSKKTEDLTDEWLLKLSDTSTFDDMVAGDERSVDLKASQLLSTTPEEIALDNKAEITSMDISNGRDPQICVDSGEDYDETLTYDDSETVTITPSTGANREYIMPIVIGVTFLAILGAGVVLIKKKVLNK